MPSKFTKCRVCGLELNSNDANTHELTCPQKSQEHMDIGGSQVNNAENEKQTEKKVRTTTNSSIPLGFGDPKSKDAKHEENLNVSTNEETTVSKVSPYPPSPDKQTAENIKSGSSYNNRNYPSDAQKTRQSKSVSSRSYSYGMDPKRDIFPPTKKYRYYPITCNYCGERFQPNEMKTHQKKRHFKETDVESNINQAVSAATRMGYDSDKDSEERKRGKARSAGGIPRRLRNCYICGRLYGSKSIKIHEPKCLKKWKIQNDKLPPNMRAPEPVKPEQAVASSGADEYSVPQADPNVETAFRAHLQSLLPCTHCERTFSPDRIQKHESCCIERPKGRECIIPEDGEIPR